MYLSPTRVTLLTHLMTQLDDPAVTAGREMRRRIGADLLRLLEADYFASYAWDDAEGRFTDRVALHMSDGNLTAYEQYYQFRDPITHRLQQRQVPTLVVEIMPQRELMRTEFFNDFLARDGLHHGVNLFAWDGAQNLGDLRIWRGRTRERFDREALDLLRLLQPGFTGALRRLRQGRAVDALAQRHPGLKGRALDIARCLCEGLPDKKIAATLGIEYSTVRTHVDALFERFGVHSRTQLVQRLLDGPLH